MDPIFSGHDNAWYEVVASSVGFRIGALSLCALLIWRIWRFTVQPALHPHYAQQLPYSVPILGQALSFFRDAEGTMTRGRLYFKNEREPFALNIMGETVYIITSAADVSAIYRRTDDLTFDAYITDTMANMGASPDATRKMWQTPQQQSKGQFANPKNEPLAHLSLTIFQHQLHPGKPMQELEEVLLDRIDKMMSWEKLQQTPRTVVKPGKISTVSLLEWTTSVMLKGATEAFFGEAMLRIDPNMLDDYSYFDKHSWKLIYKIPAPWSTGMRTARDAVRTTFAKYFSLPEDERSDACWMVKALEAEMKGCGIGPQDIGAYLMSIYWVINGNAWKLAFWMLVYILDDEVLLTEVKKEARRYMALADDPSTIVSYLERSPLLLSIWNEALRFCTSAITIRDVARETQIGGKTLKAGARVIVPYKQMLRDPEVFGHDAEMFRPRRFLENKELVKSPSFRPFGGGITYCPGRFLARKEVLFFVALVLAKFDVAKVGAEDPVPKLEEKRPCLGVLSARDGDDLLISVNPVTT